MIYLATLSLTAAILYFYVGLHVVRANRKSQLNRIFFALNLSMTVWSVGDGFLYIAKDVYASSFWNKFAAFGWCTFEAFVLYFVLVLINNKHIRLWYIKTIVLLPGFLCLAMVLFLFGPDIATKQWVSTLFYIGNFLYNFTYLFVSILMIMLWGYRSDNAIRKKQAYIISVCSLIPFIINLVVQDVLPAMHIITLPYIGQLFSLIMLLGVYYAITKYQFMSIPSALITNELFNELTGITFLADSQGIIMKANRQAYELLGHQEEDVIGKRINEVLIHPDINALTEQCGKQFIRIRRREMDIEVKGGDSIPLHISMIPLFIQKELLGGILLVGEDIRPTKQLREEIERHRITNEKLKYSERMFRNILEMAPVSIVVAGCSAGKVLYLNSHAEGLFGAQGETMIGHEISEFLMGAKEELSLLENIAKGQKISNREIQMTKKEGAVFTGLITVIPLIYQEEEAALACIIDITEQKNIEEKLKQNNDYINKLNKDLVLMNIDLMNKSIKDDLTDLYSHQYINEILESRLKDDAQISEGICLMMLDIDYFKKVNDKYGHLVGDMVLQSVANQILQNTRNEDFAGRYGGEEFIVVLPSVGLAAAVRIAERIRESVADFDYGIEGLKVSISIGVTQYGGESLNTFINRADMLLYQAKANGRNRVESVIKEID